MNYESDHYDFESDELVFFNKSPPKGWQSLNLHKNYVPGWSLTDAFREYAQNWTDAIKATNNLGSRDPSVVREAGGHEGDRLIKALHPDTRKFLGYIRYSKKQGTVEITNFDSQLSHETLKTGVTSKREDKNMAGTHGEGYKLAALVMRRHGHQVKFEASGMNWKFRLGGAKKENLGYCLSKSRKIDVRYVRIGGRTAKSNVYRDVCVQLGSVFSEAGSKGKPISGEEFDEWIKVSLLLSPPGEFVKTKQGDLILDSRFSNNIYLKGLYLRCGNWTPFKFGYNLLVGKVNRDRETLSSINQERKLLTEIWAAAMLRKPEYIQQYVDMVREGGKWEDVVDLEKHMSEETATILWKFHMDEDGEHENFYYDTEEGSQNAKIIKQSLGKIPQPLRKAFCEPFRRYGLMRTPQEQQFHLLKRAPLSTLQDTIYSKGVKRALQAVLELDPRTKILEVVFQDGTVAKLDLVVDKKGDQNRLLTNDKWLDFSASHERANCSWFGEVLAGKENVDFFSCSHIITELHELILAELSEDESPDNESSLRVKVGEKLRQMPCNVQIFQTETNGELEVTWMDPEGDREWKLYKLDKVGQVTLHKEETCRIAAEEEFLAFYPLEDGGKPVMSLQSSPSNTKCGCNCPQQMVSMKDSSVIFRGLDTSVARFPMISRANSDAFYGLPPAAITPKKAQVQASAREGQVSSRPAPVNTCYSTMRGTPRADTADPDENHSTSSLESMSEKDYSTNSTQNVSENSAVEREESISSEWFDSSLSDAESLMLNENAQKSEAECRRLEEAVRSQLLQISELTKDLENKRSELNDSTAANDIKVYKLLNDLDTARQELNTKKEKLDRANDKLELQRQNLESLKQELFSKDKLISELENGRKESTASRESTGQAAQQEAIIEKSEATITQLKANLQEAKDELEDQKEVIEESEVKITKLKGDLKEVKVELEDQKEVIEGSETRITSLKGKLKEANAELEDQKEVIEGSEVKITKLKRDLKEANAELNVLKDKVRGARLALGEDVTKKSLKREFDEWEFGSGGSEEKRAKVREEVKGKTVIELDKK